MKDPEDVNYSSSLSYFSDGTPVPELLTEEEAIKFLRLDDGETKNQVLLFNTTVQKKLLNATKVGKRLRYLKSELLKFLNEQTLRTNNDIS